MPTSKPFEGTVYHGAEEAIDAFELREPDRGMFFSGDAAYASDYGPVVHACHVRLGNAIAYDDEEAYGHMELDRNVLIAQGYDGRLVEYDNGEVDVIAFYPEQVTVLGIVPSPKIP